MPTVDEIIVLHTVVVLLSEKLGKSLLLSLRRRYCLQSFGVLLLKRRLMPDTSPLEVLVFRQVTCISLWSTPAPAVPTTAPRRLLVDTAKSVVNLSTQTDTGTQNYKITSDRIIQCLSVDSEFLGHCCDIALDISKSYAITTSSVYVNTSQASVQLDDASDICEIDVCCVPIKLVYTVLHPPVSG